MKGYDWLTYFKRRYFWVARQQDYEKIELELDEQMFEQAQLLAAAQQFTLKAWFQQLIERQIIVAAAEDPLLGMFVDGPDLIDEIVDSAMQTRETYPLRNHIEESL